MSGPERNSFSCNVTPRISFPKPSPARVIPRTLVLCERHLHTVTPATWVLLTAHSALYGNLFCDVMFMLCNLFARAGATALQLLRPTTLEISLACALRCT